MADIGHFKADRNHYETLWLQVQKELNQVRKENKAMREALKAVVNRYEEREKMKDKPTFTVSVGLYQVCKKVLESLGK